MPGTHAGVSRTVQVVRLFSAALEENERSDLLRLLRQLRELRESAISRRAKALAVARAVADHRLIQRISSRLCRLAYDIGWRNRCWPTRIGMAAAIAASASVGNQGAGIAALGGAVGVPLWLVCGAAALGTHARENLRARPGVPMGVWDYGSTIA
jgi:hypothetical protein